jgi:DNA-binding LytR/AlgR family response regulator
VVCIEVEERQTNIYTLNKVYPINLTLENFEKRLPPNIFFRISRSCIINVQAIQEIVLWFGNRYKIILANKKEVISSREKSKSLKQILKF